MTKGPWIKLYINLLDWPWFHQASTLQLFLYLLLSCNKVEKNWQDITIKRGQIVTSLDKLSLRCNQSMQTIRTNLKRLKSTKDITQETTNRYTIITICNFEYWQENINATNKLTNIQHNKQTTDNQQKDNRQLTTTKEYKIRKDYKNVDNKEQKISKNNLRKKGSFEK